ncbi:MAG TPA: hypothetical protein VE967_16795 [Gemmatimonadaceae bacterium]|nr:hypothetical protein [Gemmatimonadaceae bacterium]
MRTVKVLALASMVALAATAVAQQPDTTKNPPPPPAPAKPAPIDPSRMVAPMLIQHTSANDQRGVNQFEPAKQDTVPYEGFKVKFGAAFTQQFQGLEHSNTANPNIVSGVDRNQLIKLGHGFNNAVANLYLDAQLAPGIRVAMTSYLSARHHQESWVKDGYLMIDDSPIKFQPLENIMKYVTVRFGHFELNYGDEHFRRTDNGNAMRNPFVGNFLMDAFTTEVGGEVYARKGAFLAMVGAANGESRGQVTVPQNRSVAWTGKLGFDKQVNTDLRVRLTGSLYSHPKSNNGTLYSGDRGGGRYYLVMVNTAGTEKDSAWTGNVQPGFRSEERAFVVNPFVKYRGFEFFGNIEQSQGRAATEPEARVWKQHVGEFVYRFAGDKLFAGARFNTVKGRLAGMTGDVQVERTQAGAGWFLTKTLLLKGELMQQLYKDFPVTDIRNGGKIKGFMLEGVVAF